jgi:hypothetical protein
MSNIPCTSCGQDNAPTQVYCTHCGVILSKAPQREGDKPLPTSVAVAARRVQRIEEEPEEKRSLFSILWGVLKLPLSVALSVAAVLALMDPKTPSPESQPISNSFAILQRNIATSREVQVTIAQQVINQALAQSGRVDWIAPYDFVPVPEWVNSSVILSNGGLRFDVTFKFLSYPLHFSESFRLAGSSRQWSLKPESASIGLLPLQGPLLTLITPFMKSCASPFARELMILKNGDTLRIRPGFLDLRSRP